MATGVVLHGKCAVGPMVRDAGTDIATWRVDGFTADPALRARPGASTIANGIGAFTRDMVVSTTTVVFGVLFLVDPFSFVGSVVNGTATGVPGIRDASD